MQMRIGTFRRKRAEHTARISFPDGHPKALASAGLPLKLLTLFLLALITGFYAAPLLQAASSDPDAGLPACCRRHGRHHCAMADQAAHLSPSGTSQIGQTPQHCPLYSRSATTPVVRFHTGLAPAPAFFARAVSHTTIHPQTHVVFRLSFDRSCQKRGPPRLLFSA